MILSVAIMIVFIGIALFMLPVMFRALRGPKAYYPPRPSARELTKELMCPKCGSKGLEPASYYTIRCRSCGFMFSVAGKDLMHIILARGSGPCLDGGHSYGSGRWCGSRENEFVQTVGWLWSLSLDRMIEKARRLLKNGRVERVDGDRYNVIGDHGTYTVVQTYEGKITCNCPGFVSKGRCSHSAAVIMLTQLTKRPRRPRTQKP